MEAILNKPNSYNYRGILLRKVAFIKRKTLLKMQDNLRQKRLRATAVEIPGSGCSERE